MTSVQDVLAVLESAGFERLPKPLTVVGTEFDFEAAARGMNTSHDLVLVATDQVPRRRLQRLVAGLARSLDLASSRRPVSLVLLGGVAAADRIDLEHYARVLPIASSTPDIAEIEEAVAVLLPLKLPNADLVHGSDPVNEVMAVLGPMKATSNHITLIMAAADGPEAVREALRRYANEGAGWNDNEEDDNE
ncbi:hypothetical protein QO003_000832 [Arthrobacter silviterrae]|uniref:Uncharacterized protein n=1 Tax=Arthrobacter silviterrae TaxID=2026658 RepID=A0ABX0DIE0_9MICC|nr:hypothetical protein [Arthrobacter silviterrae]MDQ0276529.1 hypothetical protein [Arthrobacter silviterrae]NGN85195.1 hypothetical protein [Arthrobacter silviterrae]